MLKDILKSLYQVISKNKKRYFAGVLSKDGKSLQFAAYATDESDAKSIMEKDGIKVIYVKESRNDDLCDLLKIARRIL